MAKAVGEDHIPFQEIELKQGAIMQSEMINRTLQKTGNAFRIALSTVAVAGAIMIVPQTGFSGMAEAAENLPRYSIAKNCRDMKREGSPINWRGIATGKINSIGGPRNRSAFFVRGCFETRSECERFVNTIHRYRDVVSVRGAYCSKQ